LTGKDRAEFLKLHGRVVQMTVPEAGLAWLKRRAEKPLYPELRCRSNGQNDMVILKKRTA
jgi:hypothetical protein